MKAFEISHSLKKAIDNQEFELVYQPIVGSDHLSVKGFEALIRWQSQERGLIYPDSFIPIAEESDAIFDLGRFSIRKACQQLYELQRLFPEHPDWFISINLSGKQISDPFLVYELKHCIQSYQIKPSCIHIELTENILITQKVAVQYVIDKIKAFGIKLSIDDFGTGYSSLHTLSQYPFDVLKIDRFFVQDITENRKNRELVALIIQLGKALGFEVVIEGVENSDQYQVLKGLHAQYLQGYLFSKPLSETRLIEELQKGSHPHAWT